LEEGEPLVLILVVMHILQVMAVLVVVDTHISQQEGAEQQVKETTAER
jgi:hypothetical protein